MIDYHFPARGSCPCLLPRRWSSSSVDLGREADGDSSKAPENQHHSEPAEGPGHRVSRNYPAQSGQQTTEDIREPEQPPRQYEERKGFDTADSIPPPFDRIPPPFPSAASYLPADSAYKGQEERAKTQARPQDRSAQRICRK